MPFGLQGALATFQHLMNTVLAGTDAYAAKYLDGIVVYSSTWEEHLRYLGDVLGCIQEAGLTIHSLKCTLAQEEVQYLGHVIRRGVIWPQTDNVYGHS